MIHRVELYGASLPQPVTLVQHIVAHAAFIA